MSEFNFKSQICTSIDQSRRLLELGLKKDTTDMIWTHAYYSTWAATAKENPLYEADEDTIPAWSLHRLLSMLPDDAPKIYWILDGANITIDFEDDCGTFFSHKGDIYEGVVNCIKWLIKKGYFPKEYLENLTGTDSHQDMVDAIGYALMAIKKEE